ncbi:cytochrome P450 [Colletotrichum falcatum]|nr:cytochrome P450 [Colletotrichum falcatum]
MEGFAGDGHGSNPRTPSVLSVLFLVTSFGLYLLASRARRGRRRRSRLPLPPGPPRLPIVGNLFNSPVHYSWLTHFQWKHTYGPVAYCEVGGRPTVVLTTAAAAHELLNKRAGNYSNRSFGYALSELVCRGYNMLFRQYDARLRLHQRLHVHGLNPRSSALYQPIQEMESLQLLNDLLAGGKPKPGRGCGSSSSGTGEEKQMPSVVPLNPRWDFRRASASVMSLIVWGYRLEKGQPEAEREMDFFNRTSTLEVLSGPPWWIDTFPWLRHVPRCVSPWKRAGERLHEREASHHVANFRRALGRPGYNVSKHVAGGLDRLLGAAGAAAACEAERAFMAAELTLANGDTSVAVLCWLVVAAMTHPRAMREARAELDAAVGRARVPTYADRAAAPYVDAVIDEVMRWRPIIPSGMAHAAAEEDEFMGYRIPAGAAVVASQWAVTRDAGAFGGDADDFRPERWLGEGGRDLPRTSFGYGRRLCPGRHVGRDGLWIAAARLLWAFDIEAPADPATGRGRAVDAMAMPPFGIVIDPEPFEAVFKPRGAWVEALVREGMASVERDAGRIMEGIEAARAAGDG